MEKHANYRGRLLAVPDNVDSSPNEYYRTLAIPTVEECCELCANTPGCNAFAYCPTDADFDGGCYKNIFTGKLYERGACFLKKLAGDEIAMANPPAWDRGGLWVPWISGVIRP